MPNVGDNEEGNGPANAGGVMPNDGDNVIEEYQLPIRGNVPAIPGGVVRFVGKNSAEEYR